MKTVRAVAMTAGILTVAGLVAQAAAPQSAPPAGARPTPAKPASLAPQQALVQQYCVTCHTTRNKANAGNFALDTVTFDDMPASIESLERVVRKMRAGLMPPPGRPRPDAQTYSSILTALQTRLDQEAAAHPNPGRKDTFHRLNRTEYRNAVRDLLNLTVDVEDMLPVDNPSYGFDNIAGTLTLNESLMEQYLAAAQVIGTAALGLDSKPTFKEFRAGYESSQEDRLPGAPLGTRGGLAASHRFSQNGEYTIEVKLMCGSIIDAQSESGCSGAAGFPEPHRLEIAIDGALVETLTLKAKGAPGPETKEAYTFRVPVSAGDHTVAAWFVRQPSIDEFDAARLKFDKPMHRSNAVSADWMAIYQPYVASMTVGGPFKPTGPGDTASRRRLLVCQPAGQADELPCARRILSTVARRAYRRAVTKADIDDLLTYYKTGQARGGFEAGVELGLRRVLTSGHFLFRVETDPAEVKPGQNYRLSDVALASRLSFFLWRSLPDDELLDLAIAGTLHQPATLRGQVRRMLADRRAQAMMTDFAGQWLQLRKVDVVRPNSQMFPNFDDTLKRDMRMETELFVDSIRRDDRSVVDLLTADYTFLNERLAKHYGITGVKGARFRRVAYPDSARRGLFGQGSILTLTSSPIRTRPVVRGKYILENVLGTPPPAPPANVPPLPESGAAAARTMRERMAAHRANPVCAACHSMIDPLGFALENFDPVGRYRTVDENFTAIDASGTLPGGVKFGGIDDFRSALVKEPGTFVSAVTEKLMIYALGRGLEPYDMPAARKIVREAAGSNYRFSSVVTGIVTSVPFQMRRAEGPAAVSLTARSESKE